MIVDTSAILAVLFREPEALRIALAIEKNQPVTLPASCFVEASIVLLGRNRNEGLRSLDHFLAVSGMTLSPFTELQARFARDAFLRYGKGRDPKGLNFGDCMAYALAKETGEELLFKGTDFSLTDVAVAAY